MQDSLISAQYSFELAASEDRLVFETKEQNFNQQLKIQQLESERNAQNLKNAKRLQWLAFFFILMLLTVVAVISLQIKKISKQSKTLKALNDTQNKLFAIIGHDLRGPITALYSSLQRLVLSPAANETAAWPSRQLPRISSLLMTIDNLLHWSQIQQKNKTVNPIQLELASVVADVLALLDASIEEAEVKIQQEVDESIFVRADQQHLQIIIRNVIQNAIKFTPKNGTISLQASQSVNQVELKIQDTGIGFLQSKETTYKKGVHLGLKLVKELMAENQGSVAIENPAEGGALIRLLFQKA